MIFFMVLVSMIVQGTTLMPLARLLKLDQPTDDRERLPLELESTPASSGHEMKEFTVPAEAQDLSDLKHFTYLEKLNMVLS